MTDGGAAFGASVDPAGSSFVLERLSLPVQGREPIRIDLLGSNLRIDSRTEQVTIDVAIRNPFGGVPLYAPARLWVGCFEPGSVTVRNADIVSRRPGCKPWGFDYGASLGADGALLPGETSAAKPWVLHAPGLVSFSFGVEAHFGLAPEAPHIAGTIYEDGNRNGRRDAYEGPFWPGAVVVRVPGGGLVTQRAGADGSFSVPVAHTGLYTLTFQLGVMCTCIPPECCALCVTTRNPLEIVLLPGPDGRPRSYEGADFGVAHGACDDDDPPVVLLDGPPDAIPQDSYALLDARLDHHILTLRVGFSGCSPEHPFTLYAGRAFQESLPVQTWVILAHDDRDEMCEAYFERTLQFDLYRIQQEHIRAYGRPGDVRLRFVDYVGVTHSFLLRP